MGPCLTSLPSLPSRRYTPCSRSTGVAQLAERDSLRLGESEQKGGLGLGGSPESGLSRSPSRFFPFRLSSMDCRCRCPTISGTTSPNGGGFGGGGGGGGGSVEGRKKKYLGESWDYSGVALSSSEATHREREQTEKKSCQEIKRGGTTVRAKCCGETVEGIADLSSTTKSSTCALRAPPASKTMYRYRRIYSK